MDAAGSEEKHSSGIFENLDGWACGINERD